MFDGIPMGIEECGVPITDSLVPLGTVWRLGANAATLFTTDVDLTIGGKDVAKGRYVAQVLPARTGWTLILQAEATGAASVNVTPYDAKKDAARIDLRQATLASSIESLSLWLVPSTAPGAQRGELRIGWDTVMLTTEWVVRYSGPCATTSVRASDVGSGRCTETRCTASPPTSDRPTSRPCRRRGCSCSSRSCRTTRSTRVSRRQGRRAVP